MIATPPLLWSQGFFGRYVLASSLILMVEPREAFNASLQSLIFDHRAPAERKEKHVVGRESFFLNSGPQGGLV